MLHIIHFSGSINAHASSNIQSACLQALNQGATSLRLHIASEGGSTLYGFALYGFLKSLPVPVDTHNLGGVNSIANIIYLAGDRRTASPYSRFLLHPLHWTFNAGGVDHDRLREFSSTLDDDLERYIEIFNERTAEAVEPISVREIVFGKARILTPDDAVECGMAHEISDGTFLHGTPTWWVSA